MMKDYFSMYKKQLKAKYEMVKEGNNSDYLLQPTTAKLRNLCMESYADGNRDEEDKKVFKAFFGFDYDLAKRNEVVRLTEKFRPIKTFLLNETDITESNNMAANMLAILLNFEPRPLREFKKKCDESGFEADSIPVSVIKITPNPPSTLVADRNHTLDKEAPEISPKVKMPFYKLSVSTYQKTAVSLVLFIATFYIIEYFSDNKQCMQWQNNRYEAINCQEISQFKTTVLALDEKELSFRQIFPKKNDPFMKNGQPIVWYAKSENRVDFFNQDGIHPINRKKLGPVTFHIINKYGK